MKECKNNASNFKCFLKKHKRLLIILSCVILAAAVALVTTLALMGPDSNDDANPKDNPITGEKSEIVYYYEVPSGEVTLTLMKGWRFTLIGPDISKSGGYTLTGDDTITLDFVRDEDADATGILGQNKVTLTMNGATLTFKEKIRFTVSFDTNGGTEVESASVLNGKTVEIPNSPFKDGYTFAGWYSDAALTKPFDFSTNLITKNTVIYAKWTEN